MQVVASLNQGSKGSSVSYRECRLTRLMQDCFGGNGFLALVTHVSPAGMLAYTVDDNIYGFHNLANHIDNLKELNKNLQTYNSQNLTLSLDKIADINFIPIRFLFVGMEIWQEFRYVSN